MTIDKEIDLLKNNSTIKCIYCGKSADEGVILNKSDIFPSSLSNEKLTNKNVCSIEHNSKFSDDFESDVINSLAIVRNHLNITNYSNKYPEYNINLIVGDKKFPRKITKQQDILINQMRPSEDGKQFFGSIESFRKRKDFKEKNKISIDINTDEIILEISTMVHIYLTHEMKRMIAKIAYEWHCKLERINDRYSEYDSIINYITRGQVGKEPDRVRLITEPLIYKLLRKYLPLGNHLLLKINKHHKVFVYICLFGIAIYEVEVLDNHSGTDLKFDLQELYQDKNIKHFKKKFNPNESSIYNEEMLFVATLFAMDSKPNLAQQNKDFILKLLHQNTKDLLKQYYITVSSLSRFVEDYELDKSKELVLNYESTIEGPFWYFLMSVYYVGEDNSNMESYKTQTIQEIISKKLTYNKTSLISFKKILQEDKNMILKIKRGAEIILEIKKNNK